ncbi:hypothetical protein K438DRAFT_1787706 [Mycena galopus ATCC 62051]|nr:hypothetical protein K438DRAFT_1787706 [Mycena galopus ATCC 62051]
MSPIATTNVGLPITEDAGAESTAARSKRSPALSVMAELILEYNKSQDSTLSLFRRISTLASKKDLDKSDVLDRGDTHGTQTDPRFGLETGFLLRTDIVIKEMQVVLRKAAALVEGRSSYFVIDPHNVLMTVLKGANSLGELQASWAALAERLDLAQRNFRKYQSEFKPTKVEDVLLSPVSTLPEVYSVFPRNKTPANDLDYVYSQVPHHRKLWPKGYSPETDMVYDYTPVPLTLSQAFPDRTTTVRQSTVYYSADGERQEIAVSDRSSYRAGPDFRVPISEVSRGKAKSKNPAPTVEEVEDESRRSRKSSPDREPARANYQPAHWNLASAQRGILSSEIPYKAQNQFFSSRSPEGTLSALPVPGRPLPNPIFGMATRKQYEELTESKKAFIIAGCYGARRRIVPS